jgi:hypothetical protein
LSYYDSVLIFLDVRQLEVRLIRCIECIGIHDGRVDRIVLEHNRPDFPSLEDNGSRIHDRPIFREREACPLGVETMLDFALITAPDKRDPALTAKLDAVAGRVLKKV